MATVAEFTIPADDFPLGGLFERLSGVTVELERVVPTGTGVVPYLWVSEVSRDEILSALERHPAIESMAVVDSIADEHLVRVEWHDDHDGILRCIADTGVILLSASGSATEWTFEVRAQYHEDIATFQERCQDRDIPISVVTVQRLSENLLEKKYGLTTAQREALRVAYDYGYFDDPRQATLEEIASSLDISRQALAARLRRGHRNLLRNTIVRT